MSDDTPQIYLVTPPDPEREGFADTLARALDAVPVACLRLRMARADADLVTRTADGLRALAHARDVPLVIEAHVGMVERLGLDGVHLNDGARSVRKVRAALGADAIVGAACVASRHDGMSAGEHGADYVAFGPVGDSGLGDGTVAPRELFEWWSDMIEVPVVAEGALTRDLLAAYRDVADFFALGDEVWTADDPVAALNGFAAALG